MSLLTHPAPRLPSAATSLEDVSALLPRVYDELRALARRYMRYERRDHTLDPTGLVHEAFLKLSADRTTPWVDRNHFLRIAARAMRQVLVNHAETRRAAKRGGGWGRVALDHVVDLFEVPGTDLLALDEALAELQQLDERQASIVELRFFGGLSVPETADVLKTPQRTVEREWSMARAWLRRRMRDER